ncbi:hypothetical protein ASG01_13795 [Chryseobacterium sp. Leaf180]|nr:hypothetical protein ASG01_13795 [Chryseobacterium sp. Leaf180]
MSARFFSQFNTITAIVPKKSDHLTVYEEVTVEGQIRKKDTQKFWKQLLNFSAKSDLISKIDSLKTMVDSYGQQRSLLESEMESLKSNVLQLIKMQKDEVAEVQDTHQYVKTEEMKVNTTDFVKISMPLNKMLVTSSYGNRLHPIYGRKKMHNGIDLRAYYENIYSVLDGVVTDIGRDVKGGGNFIKITHFNRFETSYLHLSEIYYRTGEKVKAGYIIGKSGNSGNSTGPHLHFSVKELGQNINPSDFLSDLVKVYNLTTRYNE